MLMLLVCLAVTAVRGVGSAEGLAEDARYGWREELREGFDVTCRGLSWGTSQGLANTDQNPDNNFAQLPEALLTTELRPDVSLVYRRFDFSLKPRARFEWQRIFQGEAAGETAIENELFINEWRVRAQLNEQLLGSYGRENLQWGPSYLSSASNPFFDVNGRSDLNAEVRGRDFARLVWMPSDRWTLSAIANTAAGASTSTDPFVPVYALKLDWVGAEAYAGLITSHKEGRLGRLGAFFNRTASDALLVYAEGRVQQGSEALYPTAADNPLGMSLEATKQEDSALYGVGLIGASYTLEIGPTLTLEYLYNGPGYSGQEAAEYYRLRRQAAELFSDPGPLTGLAAQTLSATASPGQNFLRRHYLMLQYVHCDLADRISLTGRWTLNLEDQSTRLYGSMLYSLGDQVELFVTGVLNSTESDTEFGALYHYQCTLGLTYVF
jgi:hypothetical protein